jgi:hypothetical protein
MVSSTRRAGLDEADAAAKAYLPAGVPLLPAVWAVGGIAVLGMLTFATQTTSRGDRAKAVVKASLAALNRSKGVVGVVKGPSYPAGSYSLDTGGLLSSRRASGWFGLVGPGQVKGRAFLEAERPDSTAAWNIVYLRLILDARGLETRNSRRREEAVAAGYMSPGESAAAAAQEASALTAGGFVEAAPGVLVLQVVGDPPAKEVELSGLPFPPPCPV